MTGEMKPILENQNPIEWVQRRAACTIEVVFSWLFNQVKTDIDAANKVSRKNNGRNFSISGNDARGRFAVCQGDEPAIENVMVAFVRGEEKIEINRSPGHKALIITREWNLEEAYCVLRLDNKPTELWSISQHALYDVIFNSPVSHD